MKLDKVQIKKALVRMASVFPSKLPSGMQDFNVWADSIIFAYDLPDNDSLRFGLATAILHLESSAKIEINLGIVKIAIPSSAYKSRRYFAQIMLKGAANQIASGVMQDLKQKQQEAMAKEAAEREAAINAESTKVE